MLRQQVGRLEGPYEDVAVYVASQQKPHLQDGSYQTLSPTGNHGRGYHDSYRAPKDGG